MSNEEINLAKETTSLEEKGFPLNEVSFLVPGGEELDPLGRKNVELYLERLGPCGFCEGNKIITNGYYAECNAEDLCHAPVMDAHTGYMLMYGRRVGMIKGRHEMPVEEYLLPEETTEEAGYDVHLWAKSVGVGVKYARRLVEESALQPEEKPRPETRGTSLIKKMAQWSEGVRGVLKPQGFSAIAAKEEEIPRPRPVVHLYLTGLTVAALGLTKGLKGGGAEVVLFSYDRETGEYIPIPM